MLNKNIHFDLNIVLVSSCLHGILTIFLVQNKLFLTHDKVHKNNILETNNSLIAESLYKPINFRKLSTEKINIESQSWQSTNNTDNSFNTYPEKKQLKTVTKSNFYLPEQEVPIEAKVTTKTVTKSNSELVSSATLELIREFEGFRSQAYRDTDGTPVIGYGLSKIGGKKVQMGDRISIDRAEAALKAEVHATQQQIQSIVEVELNHHQLGALTSFAFNAGFYSLKESTLLRKLNAGDREGAANEFLRWNKAHSGGRLVPMAGLTRRRQAEKELFLSNPAL